MSNCQLQVQILTYYTVIQCLLTCDLLVFIILSHKNRNVIPRFHDISCHPTVPKTKSYSIFPLYGILLHIYIFEAASAVIKFTSRFTSSRLEGVLQSSEDYKTSYQSLTCLK
jgi:hypothetical protein